MSGQSAYICMVARPINSDRADGFQVRHLCKRSTCANGTVDGFFIPVSPLGETCDGLVRTALQSLSHRNRLLLSMDREQTSWQPVFGKRCPRPEGDLRIARYTWYHHLGQWSTIQCSDISPVCNELWVCACDEFSAIPSIERRSRTSCAYHEGTSEEERRSTHRSHGIQIDATSEWAISSRNAHGPKIAHSTTHPPNRSETEGFPRRVPGKEGRSTSFRPAAKVNLRHKAHDLPKLQIGDPVWIRDQNRQGQVVSRTPEPRSYLVRTDLGTVRRNRRAPVPTSHDNDDSNRRWTPPARVSTTSDIATPTVETQVPTTPAKSVSLPTREIPPLPEPPAPDRVTRSGRTVKPPKRLDL